MEYILLCVLKYYGGSVYWCIIIGLVCNVVLKCWQGDLHVGGVWLQAANDHGDGGQGVKDVPQHHARRLRPRQDVIHKTQHGLCEEGYEMYV